MLQQAQDFLADVEVLAGLLETLSSDDWNRATTFKSWTFNQVVQHLHGTDHVADLALRDADAFRAMASSPSETRQAMNPVIEGRELLDAWLGKARALAEQMGALDGSARVPWFGPDMGVKMFATARQMETWAHGQAIFDVMGVARTETDRLKNIAVIGVKTFDAHACLQPRPAGSSEGVNRSRQGRPYCCPASRPSRQCAASMPQRRMTASLPPSGHSHV